MKFIPTPNFNMNAEEQTLNDLNMKYNDIVSPDESASQYDNFNSNKGLLDIAAGGAAGTGLYLAKKAIPEQTVRHFANQSMNFLEGFYKPGITQWGKTNLYAQEAAKATGRMIKMATNPWEAISYANTGVSPLIKSKIGSMEGQLTDIDLKFLKGEYGKIAYHKPDKDGFRAIDTQRGAIKKVKQLKNKLIKERHYKVLNDAANREIFGGKISPLLTEYRKRKPHLKNYWDYDKVGNQFRASAGNDDIAEYVVSRQKTGLPGFKQRLSMWSTNEAGQRIKNPNLRYIKWFDNSISGVLRGAQFNYPTYEALNELKTKRMGKLEAVKYLESKGFKPSIRGKKILFSFNPSIKSNFDWGGYNAVAEWDYSKKGRVTLHATDLRDTPVSSLFKGKNVVNYVQAKDIKIKTIKKHTDMDTKPNFIKEKEYKKKKAKASTPKPLTPAEKATRQDIFKSKMLEPGGQIKTVRGDLHTLKDKADKAKSNVKLRNLFKSGVKGKNLLKYAKYAKYGSGAGMAFLLAAHLLGKKDN